MPLLPTDNSELWSVFLQCSHSLGPLILPERPLWAKWLLHSVSHSVADNVSSNTDIVSVKEALVRCFDAADSCIQESLKDLDMKGFETPSDEHILQIAEKKGCNVPRLLLCAALSHLSPTEPTSSVDDDIEFRNTSLAGSLLKSDERLGYWGYKDSSFIINVDRNGAPVVSMRGGRYRSENDKIRGLVDFVESETGILIDPMYEAFKKSRRFPHSHTMKTALRSRDLADLQGVVGMCTIDDSERTRHGTGHSIEDVFQIRSGHRMRVPDAVVWPNSEAEVEGTIKLAAAKNWCIIPFGGGTNVSHATRCPPLSVDFRPIISMDLTRLNKVLWVDHENMLAHVQAGIRGGDLVRQMRSRGYTIGHEPDSIEFSTLGGWIATKASGMKRNKYGNIEDIVKDVRVVTAQGKLHRGEMGAPVWGRTSAGLDLTSLVLGSEGCLGVITSAVIRIWPTAEEHEYEGILFNDFSAGVEFIHDLAKFDGEKPASCRLLDNEHFRLGMALRPETTSLLSQFRTILGKIIFKQTCFDEERCVCVTIMYESSRLSVDAQKHVVRRLTRKHGGLSLGRDAGRRGCKRLTLYRSKDACYATTLSLTLPYLLTTHSLLSLFKQMI